MTIEQGLEGRLKGLASNAKAGNIILELIGSTIDEVSTYLAANRIHHCSLARHGKIVVAYGNYQEIKELDDSYGVHVTDVLLDTNGRNALRRLGPRVRLHPAFDHTHQRPQDVYDVKDQQVSGHIDHTGRFDAKKHGANELAPCMSTFHGTFEKLFDVLLDPEVTYVEGSTRMQMR